MADPRPRPGVLMRAAPYVFSLVLLELTLRLLLAQPFLTRRLDAFGDTGRRVARVAMARARSDDDVLRAASSSPLRHHPTRGWASRPGHFEQDGVPVTVDAHGLRTVRPVADEKDGRTRILVLGDSFAFGDEVGDEDTWEHRLQEQVEGIEVLNLATLGYGQDQMLLSLREDGLPLKPDVVLATFKGCLPERNTDTFNAWQKPRFFVEDGALVLTGAPVPMPEEVMRADRWSLRLLDVGRMALEWRHRRGAAHQDDIRRTTTALLDALEAESRAAGATFVMPWVPLPGGYGNLLANAEQGHLEDHDLDPLQPIWRDWCAQHPDVPCPSLAADFVPALRAGHRLVERTHWDVEAQDLIAQAMDRELRALGIAPPLIHEDPDPQVWPAP